MLNCRCSADQDKLASVDNICPVNVDKIKLTSVDYVESAGVDLWLQHSYYITKL